MWRLVAVALAALAVYGGFILLVAAFCGMNGPDEAAPGPRDDS